MGFLGHMAVLFHFFKESPHCSVSRVFDSSHSDWREMIPHCGFGLHFSDNEDVESIFSCVC